MRRLDLLGGLVGTDNAVIHGKCSLPVAARFSVLVKGTTPKIIRDH
jgi:hypothetical protein